MQYPVDKPIFYDLEVFPGYLLAGFQVPGVGNFQYVNDRESVNNFLYWARQNRYQLVGFNSQRYDDVVLTHWLQQGDEDHMSGYEMSKRIIVDGENPWGFPNEIKSIDLMPVLPGRMGLKKIGVCLGHKKLQELPVDYDKQPDANEHQTLCFYNINDLEITNKLYQEILGELELRSNLSEAYGLDLRSFGEATLAERILLFELGQRGQKNNKKQLNKRAWEIVSDEVFVFEPFWWGPLVFNQLPVTEALGYEIFNTPIQLDHFGRMARREGSINHLVFIDDRYYQLGVGGLHSIDGPGKWEPKEDEVMFDIDVASYYPNIVLTNRLYPRAWGGVFLDIYQDIVDRRMKAKADGDKTTAQVLKIAANGTYGKSSEPYSSLYDPQLTANVTLLGQLGLLTLIEMLVGTATICSANTDGITVLVKKAKEAQLRIIVEAWEKETKLQMEYTQYAKLLQRDVNNYVAVKPDGNVKQKGYFLDKWPDLRHTPSANIIATAIKEMASKGTPILETIRDCGDLNQFLLTQNLTGKVSTRWNNQPLGKVLRFYKSNYADAAPILSTRGDKVQIVPDSEDCRPVEDLPDYFPSDVNRMWYINKAEKVWEVINNPKTAGMNRWAEYMYYMYLSPCLMDKSKRWGKANVTRGDTDFTSIKPNEQIGVKTGGNIIGWVSEETGQVKFYFTSKAYPSKSRDVLAKNEGYRLYYGWRLPHCGPVHVHDEVDWDSSYTASELAKVGR